MYQEGIIETTVSNIDSSEAEELMGVTNQNEVLETNKSTSKAHLGEVGKPRMGIKP